MTMPTPETLTAREGHTRYQNVTPDTLLDIERNTAGNELPGSKFQATLEEATRERWLDDMGGTMEYSASIAAEHAPAYFGREVSWRNGVMIVCED